jgi:hypothetical protein
VRFGRGPHGGDLAIAECLFELLLWHSFLVISILKFFGE